MIENENDVQAPEPQPVPETPAEDVQDGQEIPALDALEGLEDASTGGAASDAGASTVETVYVAVVEDRPFMTTSFQDYSVTEGLLLLVFVLLFAQFFLNLVRRWF